MKKQVEKLVVLLGVAGAFVLMSFNEPRWFDKAVEVKEYCLGKGSKFVILRETQYSYYGYCECQPGWFGDRCEFREDDL